MAKSVRKGGTRPGAGRKPVKDKKEQLPMYVSQEKIKEWGGKSALRGALSIFIEQGPLEQERLIAAKETLDAAVGANKAIAPSAGTILVAKDKPFKGDIQKRIADIEAETPPKERDTPLGRKAFELEKKQRIEELKNNPQ